MPISLSLQGKLDWLLLDVKLDRLLLDTLHQDICLFACLPEELLDTN